MEEGEVIGTGGYGCVFYFGKNYVGKINIFDSPMSDEYGIENTEQFKAIQNRILTIDPEHRYFIPTKYIIKMKSTDTRLSKCLKILRNYKYFKPRYSYDVLLQERVDSPPNKKLWTEEQIQHAIDGLKLLHANNLVHNDVALQNYGFKNNFPVLIDMDGTSEALEVRPRFIKGEYTIDFNQTPEFDWQQFQKIFK